MPWKGHNHLSTLKPATACGECKEDVSRPDIGIVLANAMRASCGCCMTNQSGTPPPPESQRRYKWPWFVLAAVLLAIALAVLWMSQEIARTRHIRDLNEPAPATNRGATWPGPSSPATPERH
jgi:hypothetical protein